MKREDNGKSWNDVTYVSGAYIHHALYTWGGRNIEVDQPLCML